MGKINLINDSEIKVKGIEALNNVLGPSNALRFLALINREPTDYVEISQRLYKNQSIDEIFERNQKKG